MNNPKYTFLLPAYKGRFLDEMLQSIHSQTYTNYKVIISDDCSPEDLRSICEPYLSDPRFCYRRNEENMGSKSLVSHWNLLVNMCDTEFLIMASDDDVYEPQFLEEIDKLTVKYPNVDLFRARVDVINENKNVIKEDREFCEYETHRQFLESFFSKGNNKCIANYVFKTSQLKKNHGFYETPLAWGADEITVIEVSDQGCGYTKDILFHFRISDVNISGMKQLPKIASQKAIALLYADEWFENYLKRNNIDNFQYERWGKMIYYFLMDAEFITFLKLYPKVISSGLWNTDWMMAITRHQLKSLICKK